jgi:RNA polymerase sigma-70 factor, ECF subfamily
MMVAAASEWPEPELDDGELVGRILGGDAEAFAPLVDRYKRTVYNLSYRMLGGACDAEDAAQEVFIRAYTQLGSFERGRKFSTWLLAIASHYCIDQLRRRHIDWLPVEDILPWVRDADDGPEEAAMKQEGDETAMALLRRLPVNYRAITVLRYWHDLPYEEIGRILGLPESTIKIRLHRARKMLAELVGSKEGEGNALSRR